MLIIPGDPWERGSAMVRHVVDLLKGLLDADRRTNQGLGALERDWPVRLQVPLTPVEYDALRFLSSLYPANPSEIARASVLPFLDDGSVPPARREDAMDGERTARVEIGMDSREAVAMDRLANDAGVTTGTLARWALWETLGPLMDVPRP